MARIRSIKPEFWDDELVASLSRDARLLFIATWNLADDAGRLRWSAPYVKAKVFAYDEDLDVKAVGELMFELERSGRVQPYVVTETITQTFALVVNFPRHQRINRAQESSLPPPPPDGPGNGRSPTSLTEHSVNEQCAGIDEPVQAQLPDTDHSLAEGKGREGKGAGKGSVCAPAPPPRPDVESVCVHLRDRIVSNGSRRPEITNGWREAARLLIDKDQRPPEEIHRLIDWCQAHAFWQSNVLSMPKLREKYDQLRLQSRRDTNSHREKRSPTGAAADATRAAFAARRAAAGLPNVRALPPAQGQ